ncbi:MAG: hypothetical protein R2776_07155 [Flavobacteriaceae bacterium]|nr:hypothetical protein [Flavobacteriaceae bacterium]
MGAYRIVEKNKENEIEFPITKAYFLVIILGLIVTPFLLEIISFLIIILFFILFIIVFGIIQLYNFGRIPKIKGKYAGTIEFFEDKIQIKSEIYSLSEISTIRFYVSDYVGKWTILFFSLDPNRSNGSENLIEIVLKTGSTIRVFFQLHHSKQFLENRENLINYHKAGKISFLKLIEVLQIRKYELIQNFKNELNQ